jgi:acylphosphatase
MPDLERLLEWLREGPPGAHVHGVDTQWLPWSGRFHGFEVVF